MTVPHPDRTPERGSQAEPSVDIPLNPHDFHGEWNYAINAPSNPA